MAKSVKVPIEALPTPAAAPMAPEVEDYETGKALDEMAQEESDSEPVDVSKYTRGSSWYHRKKKKMVTLLSDPDSRHRVAATVPTGNGGFTTSIVRLEDLDLEAAARYKYWWQGDNLSIRRVNPQGGGDDTVILPSSEIRRVLEALMQHPSYDSVAAEMADVAEFTAREQAGAGYEVD
jgi:hypothetical protein